MTSDPLPTVALTAAVEALRAVDVDRLADGQLRTTVGQVQTAIRRLEAVKTRLAGTLTHRARAAARAAADGDVLAGQRAEQQARRQLAGDLRLSPSQAKQLTADHRRTEQLPAAQEAFADGAIATEHLRRLDHTLKGLPPELHARLEPPLVEAARTQDPVTFGRTCRAALAEVDPDQAMADLDDQYRRRSARLTQRPDGMTHLAADLAGVDAAFVHTTLDAFRTQDATGMPRTAEQRTADALVELVKAAAGTIGDPTARHARPVFLLQLPADRLLHPGELQRLRDGSGTETFTGPLPLGELTRLLGDAHIAALLADATGLPLAVTDQTRAVPIGLWRLLVARDGGCITHGCDAPPGWCQVAHLGDWHADGGRLAPNTAGLLCSRDHHHYDTGRLAVTWHNGRPTVHPPGQPDERRGGRHPKPAQPPAADHPPDEPPTLPGIASEPRGTYRIRPPTAASRPQNTWTVTSETRETLPLAVYARGATAGTGRTGQVQPWPTGLDS